MKMILLYLMAFLYVLAGVWHFVKPQMYNSIMPPWLPYPFALIYITGVLEIVLGIILCFSSLRQNAAWGIIVLLILIFPANIQMFLNYQRMHHPQTWIALLRLPLQAVLIWWAWIYTKS